MYKNLLSLVCAGIAIVTGLFCGGYFAYWSMSTLFVISGGSALGLIVCLLFTAPVIRVAAMIMLPWICISAYVVETIGDE